MERTYGVDTGSALGYNYNICSLKCVDKQAFFSQGLVGESLRTGPLEKEVCFFILDIFKNMYSNLRTFEKCFEIGVGRGSTDPLNFLFSLNLTKVFFHSIMIELN